MSDSSKDEYIKKISAKSDRCGDKLIDFLDKYKLQGLIEATEEQLKEYYESEVITYGN